MCFGQRWMILSNMLVLGMGLTEKKKKLKLKMFDLSLSALKIRYRSDTKGQKMWKLKWITERVIYEGNSSPEEDGKLFFQFPAATHDPFGGGLAFSAAVAAGIWPDSSLAVCTAVYLPYKSPKMPVTDPLLFPASVKLWAGLGHPNPRCNSVLDFCLEEWLGCVSWWQGIAAYPKSTCQWVKDFFKLFFCRDFKRIQENMV